MRIAFLTGAYKNAGDYLIESRAMALLKHIEPKVELYRCLRNKITENIDEINHCDHILFGGGPIYKRDLDGYLPLDVCINKMEKPISILGGGWYGIGSGSMQIKKYSFSSKTVSFLKRVSREGGLGCRDIISYQILKNYGFDNVYLTGCPAWYDLDNINFNNIRSINRNTNTIVVSDPALRWNQKSCLKVIDYVIDRYPNAKIVFAFHRDVSKRLYNMVLRKNIEIINISGSTEGFHIYDRCDMHIGYRVHAHIYNLSIRNKSILIEEDGRGAGVDQSLGLPQIKAFSDQFQFGNDFLDKMYRRMPFYENDGLIYQIDAYLDVLEKTKDQYLINAFKMQQIYYKSMIAFIQDRIFHVSKI